MKKKPETTLLKIKIPQELKEDFKVLCHVKDSTMTDAVIQLLKEACQQRHEDITEIKERRDKKYQT